MKRNSKTTTGNFSERSRILIIKIDPAKWLVIGGAGKTIKKLKKNRAEITLK